MDMTLGLNIYRSHKTKVYGYLIANISENYFSMFIVHFNKKTISFFPIKIIKRGNFSREIQLLLLIGTPLRALIQFDLFLESLIVSLSSKERQWIKLLQKWQSFSLRISNNKNRYKINCLLVLCEKYFRTWLVLRSCQI